MSKKSELKPVDLSHLEAKCLGIVDAFDKYHDVDRSEGYREHQLKAAESLAKSLLRDFRFVFDCYQIGGVAPYGLEDGEE